MSKISRDLDNPLDRYLYDVSGYLLPAFKKMSFTPNYITTLSLLTGLGSVYCIYTKNFLWSIVLIWISYLFDCMDGMFARTYNMVSKFGDYYDHIKDIIVGILLFIMILNQFSFHGKINISILAVIVAYLSLIYICNFERYYKIKSGKNDTDSLNFLSRMCIQTKDVRKIEGQLKKYRYIGFNLSYIAMSVILIYLYIKQAM